MKTASALKLHILFFLLRGFLLLLIAALLLQKLHFLRDGVLRFGLLLDLGLLRREDFADPIANIFHRLQSLLGGGKLSGKLCVGRLQIAVLCLQYFKYIEFAVYCRDYETENYDAFRQTLCGRR